MRDEGRPASGRVRMFINLGRRHGLNPEKLTALVSRECEYDVPGASIEIMKTHSFFDVARKKADRLTLALGTAKYGARELRVAPVDDDKKGKRFKRPKPRTKAHKYGARK